MAKNHLILKWHELHELRLTVQVDLEFQEEHIAERRILQEVTEHMENMLDRTEDSTVFDLLPDCGRQTREDIILSHDVLRSLAASLDRRLGRPPLPDGECADNDILDILLPLQQKLHQWSAFHIQHLLLCG